MAINLNDVDVTNLEQIVTLLNQLNTDLSSKLNTAENNVNNINSNISALQLAVSGIETGLKIKLLGSGTSFNLKDNYTIYGISSTVYQNLTNANFIVEPITTIISGTLEWSTVKPQKNTGGTETGNVTLTKNYNKDTGELTISGLTGNVVYHGFADTYGAARGSFSTSVNVYLIY